jgi:iron complex outermembrane receptor protein
MRNPLWAAIALATLAAVESATLIADDDMMEEVTVIGASTIFANNAVTASMFNQQTPITSPLSLIDNLPGISIQEGDTYGFDDWSTTISMRGFQVSLSDQQIGMTIDGLPNGNSNYGGGAKANRFIDNQNIAGVDVSQGTADISSRSNEALGGTLDFLTSDPDSEAGLLVSATGGQFDGKRYFMRYNTGQLFNSETYAWVSASHQEATDWVNGAAENQRAHFAGKIISEIASLKLTGYLAYDDTHEDNYQRLFSAEEFLANPVSDQLTDTWTGLPYVDQLYRKGWSTLRENLFSYVKIELPFGDNVDVSGAFYYHNNEGRGDWVPPYLVDVTNDGAGAAQTELNSNTVNGGPPLGRIFFVNAAGVALAPTAGCVSSITFPYGGAGPEYDPACYPAGAIPVQSYRHTNYEKERTGLTADIAWNLMVGSIENNVRAGVWYEDYLRGETRTWQKIIDTRVGFDFNHTPYWTQYDREYPQTTFKWYLEDSVDVGSVTLNFGVKQFLVDIDRRDNFGASANVNLNSDSDVLFSGGGIWRLPVDGLEIFGGYSENFSALSDDILERPDSNLGTLAPETAENVEIGARYSNDRVKVSATYYDINFENRVIFLAANTVAGPDYLIGTDGSYFNAGGVDSSGLELSGSLDLTETVSMYLSYTNNKSEYLGTGDAQVDAAVGIVPGNDVINMPDTMYVASIDWRKGPFNAGISFKFTDDRFVNVSNTWRADAYTTSDFYMNYTPKDLPGFMRGMAFNLVINNLTDESYLGGISGGGAWIGAPRTVALSVTLDLNGAD